MTDIFISYARIDRAKAEMLSHALKDQGWSVWWDLKIPPGKTFDQVIQKQLADARVVIVLWSKTSVTSNWVKEEATEGLNKGGLVPILVSDVQIPLGFRRIEAANLINWQGEVSHPEFLNVLDAINEILGHQKQPAKSDIEQPLKTALTTTINVVSPPYKHEINGALDTQSSNKNALTSELDSGTLNDDLSTNEADVDVLKTDINLNEPRLISGFTKYSVWAIAVILLGITITYFDLLQKIEQVIKNENYDKTDPAATSIEKSSAVAVVNGRYIPKSKLVQLEKEIAERGNGQTFPKDKLIEELIQRELLAQYAIKNQPDASPEVMSQLEAAMKKSLLTQADPPEFITKLDSAYKTLLAQAAVQNLTKANPVTDAEIKAEYDSKIAGENGTEYKARHILVKTEAEARKLIVKLDEGADFDKLANKYSLDAKESQNGGDLGWFTASQMVAPFSDAVVKLEKGEYTKTPVQTQFGWHVILREDSRTQTPPSLESVKEQLIPYLQRKKVQNMVETLRKEARVEILVPLTDEPPKALAKDKAVAETKK